MSEKLTDFGYQKVSFSEKTAKVGDVFDSVANNYDLMNDLMSLGIHRVWKKIALSLNTIRPGYTVLDLACGSGDLGLKLAEKVGPKGQVILADINPSMLQHGRDKLLNHGFCNAQYTLVNAESLSFADDSFDAITIGFGLRNVSDKDAALKEMYRVLKPGATCTILEFSESSNPVVKKAYDAYSFKILPKLGELVAKDSASYQYLAESIRMHPSKEKLCQMMEQAGFEDCRYHSLNAGIVAIHMGCKY